jgi:hypothetical protein
MESIDQLRAALEQLEAEKARRIEDRIASGAVAVVEMPPVVGAFPEVAEALLAEAQARKTEELRAAGEKRPIHFRAARNSTWRFDELEPIGAVITGVPRREDERVIETLAPEVRKALSAVPPPGSQLPAPRPYVTVEHAGRGSIATNLRVANMEEEAPPVAPPAISSEPEYVWVTTRAPTDDDDPGTIAEAHFVVEDQEVLLLGAEDEVINRRTLLPGDDPRRVAQRLLLECRGEDASDPIQYPPLKLA